MLVLVDIPDELLEKTKERFTLIARHNRMLEASVISKASAKEAGERAIVYEAMLNGIEEGLKEKKEESGS